MTKLIIFVIVLLASLAGRASAALLGQATTNPGQSFASVCAGQNFSSFGDPGQAINGGVSDSLKDCSYGYGIGSAVTASISKSGTSTSGSSSATWSGDATAIADKGVIKVTAAGTGAAMTYFSGSAAMAGWDDTFTITGGTGNYIWMVPLYVHGNIDTTGIGGSGYGGSGAVAFAAYKNNNPLQPYGSGINSAAYTQFTSMNVTHYGTISSGWDYEMVMWGATTWNQGDPANTYHVGAGNWVWFAIPVVYDTPFEAGFYMAAMASQRSYGGGTDQNASTADFGHTVTWGGKGFLLNADGSGTGISDFTISSGSGFNYNQAVTPEPSAGALMLSGICLLTGVRRYYWRISTLGKRDRV